MAITRQISVQAGTWRWAWLEDDQHDIVVLTLVERGGAERRIGTMSKSDLRAVVAALDGQTPRGQ